MIPLLTIGALCAIFTAGSVFALSTFGPPARCRYLVPIKTHPGVYACSSHPRPLVKP